MKAKNARRVATVSPIDRDLIALRKAAGIAIVLGACLRMAALSGAQLQSGVYQTLPGTSVQESGDRVPNGTRVVSLSATLTFDLTAAQPSLTAVVADAVLEGGAPFALTVRSSSGSQQVDGTYRFAGDYLRDLYPSGTQYLFDWGFSARTNGEVAWNGTTYWAGGHIWYIAISNVIMVPVPWLTIGRMGSASVHISWATNFAGYVLEYSTALPALGWGTVTNATTNTGERISVTLDAGMSNRFYRLRKP